MNRPQCKPHESKKSTPPFRSGFKPAVLLQEALPTDWTAEETAFFRNWLEQTVRLHDVLASTAAERHKVLWRACRVYHKLRIALVRAAQAAETPQGKTAASVGQAPQ